MNQFTRIKGLSDVRRLPRLGKIRLGITMQKSGKQYPAEIPFFLLPEEHGVARMYGGFFRGHRESDPALIGKAARQCAIDMGCTRDAILGWVEKNGWMLTDELPIMLPVEDECAVFPQAYKLYGSTAGLKCIGNGETAQRGKEIVDCPCNQLKSDENPRGACLTTATLNLVLPDISLGGVFQMTTHAYNSILDINSGIEVAKKQSSTRQFPNGRISMVPFKLRRIKTITHKADDKGDPGKQTHWTIQILSALNMEGLARLRQDIDSLPTVEPRLALPGPEDTVVEPDYDSITDEEKQAALGPEEVVEAEFEDKVEETPAPADIKDEEAQGDDPGYEDDCRMKLDVINMTPSSKALGDVWADINLDTAVNTGYPPELRAKLEKARAEKAKALKVAGK